jgi:hypothetical protein
MVNFTYKYKIYDDLVIDGKKIIVIKFPLSNIEVFINAETKEIYHVFKCDAVIRPDKDFKHEIKDQKLRRFYITAALNLI